MVSSDKSGRSLEQAVGRIQQLLDPNSSITYREKIPNRLGILREFDVVVRGEFAGHLMLGVIECKDWSEKVGTPEVDAFVTKTRDINANLCLIVSPTGPYQLAVHRYWGCINLDIEKVPHIPHLKIEVRRG